ncbi:MAG: guanylate kinase [bacterium]
MIKNKVTGDLIILSGPSGSGKDSVVGKILNKDLTLAVSATTRSKREGEVDGVDYFFLTKEEFESKIEADDFLEYAIVHNKDYYGTLKSEVIKKLEKKEDVVLVIDIKGALLIKEKFPSAIFIFLLPPSVQILKERLILRNTEDKDSMLRRFTSLYKEINSISKYNYVVINDDLDEAASKIKSILVSEKCRVDRIDDLVIDTKEEEIHEEIITYFDKTN